jgi:hypothetical protein
VLGTVRVSCFDGQTSLLDGGCGPQNCAAGEIDSNGALIAHPAMNDGKASGPFSCPAPFSGEAAVGCNRGVSRTSRVTLYDEEFDETFVLCRCCELRQSPPEPPMLEPAQREVSLIAVSAGLLAGFICASATGYHFLKQGDKVSKVVPEEGKGGFFSRFTKHGKSQGKKQNKDKKEKPKAQPEGIKEKLQAALSVFVGVFLCGYLLSRLAECLRNACESLKERRAKSKASSSKKAKKPSEEMEKPSEDSEDLRKAGESEPAPEVPIDIDNTTGEGNVGESEPSPEVPIDVDKTTGTEPSAEPPQGP